MIQAYYTAANTMMNQQKRINAIAGNISNVNTDGYKKTDVEFSEMLYSQYNQDFGNNMNESIGIGNGITSNGVIKDFTQGTMFSTGAALDLALDGNGFFALDRGNGDIVYSGSSSFSISVEDGGNYIVSNDGYYLLDENMQRVEYSEGMSISSEGLISVMNSYEAPAESDGTIDEPQAQSTTGQRIMVYEFANPAGLTNLGGGLFTPGNASGAAQIAEKTKVMQGYAEKSNVDIATEMTELIKVQRIYQMNSKIVQTADEMKALANRLRK